MSRELAPEDRKDRRTITIDPKLSAWLQGRADSGEAKSYSNAIESCVRWCRREMGAKERRDTAAKEGER